MNRILLCALLLGTPVCAQPLVQLPQGNYVCLVDVVPKRPADVPSLGEAPMPSAKKRVITQVGELRKDEIVWTDNSVLQVWMLRQEGLAVSEQKGSDGKPRAFVLTGSLRDSVCPVLLRLEAGSLSWITPDNLVKEAGSAPNAPLHYRTEIHHASVRAEFQGLPDTPASTVVYEAWIDPKTLLPIKLDDGEATYVLQFGKEAPAGPLVMPEHLAAELKRWSEAMATHAHL